MKRNLDNYTDQYNNHEYEKFQVYYRKKKIKEILNKYEHSVMLEIGCGSESIFKVIDSYKKIYIVEPAVFFYNKAVFDSKKNKRKDDILIINKLVEDCQLEFNGINFDFVLLSGLLHEIKQPHYLLKHLYDKLSKNTIVHINVPNAKSFHRLLAVEMGLIKNEFQKSENDNLFQRNSVFDMDSLKKIVEDQGFEVIEQGSFSFKPFTHQQMDNMMQQKLISEDMLEGFYKMEKYIPDLGSEIFVNVRKKQISKLKFTKI